MTPWTTSLGSPSSTTGACETYKHWKAPLEWGPNTVRTSPTVSAHGSPRWMRSTRSRVSKARFVSTEKSVRTHALKTSSTHQKNWSHTSHSSTVYNRSLRDVQALEGPIGMGAQHSKDFAYGIGPWITTMDEIDSIEGLKGQIRVNGEVRSDTRVENFVYTPEELVAYISIFNGLQP